MCIAICQMLSTYMFDFHVCVYIACICAGGRNLLISQLFILPVCICRHPVLYMYNVICCQLVCLLIMYVYCMSLSCMYLSWRHGRTAPWPSCLSRLKNLIRGGGHKDVDMPSDIRDI